MATNRLSSAYRARGRASSRYKSSLYDIEGLGFEREASQAMYDFETQQRDTTIALIQEGIGLASDVYGGLKSKAEAKAGRASVQEGMAKHAYKGETPWGKLGIDEKAAELSKFTPKEVKRSLGDWLTGGERKYTFGKGEGEFTSSQITAASTLYGENKLSDLLGITTSTTAIEELRESLENKGVGGVETDTDTDVDVGDTSITAGKDDPYGVEEGLEYMKVPGFEDLGIKDTHKAHKKVETVEDVSTTSNEEVDLSKIGDFEIPSLLGDDEDLPGHWAREPKRKGIVSYAEGGEFTTDGPEVILVGDNPGGKEKVTVKPIKSNKKEKSEGQNNLADNVGSNLKDLVSRKGMRPGSKNWLKNYIRPQKVNNESLRPLSGELSKYNERLFSMAEESGYFGEFFRGGWE